MVPKAILFDLDETLTDRSRSLLNYSHTFLESFHKNLSAITPEEVFRILKTADGDGYRAREEVFVQLTNELPWAHDPLEVFRISEHWASTFPICSAATTGMYDVLNNLKSQGIVLGIITNGGTLSQNRKIDTLGIRKYLSTTIISEAVKIKKPNKKIFAIALGEINMNASDTWFIGDHPVNDILGSASAGLTPVWVRGIHPWIEGHDEPSFQIDSISQLSSLIKDAAHF